MEKNNTINNQLILDALRATYPDDAEALFRLCNHGLEQPLGIDHPVIIQDLIGTKLNQDDFEKIQVGYVMITAYYFLLDAVADGHLDDNLNSLYLTHLLTLACQKFDEVIFSNSKVDFKNFNSTFHQLVSENAKAIRLENQFSSNAFTFSEEKEYSSIVGRSNSSIILLELIASLTQANNKNSLKEILKDFAFFVQLGDDLADWRDDYKAQKYSSFLRELFSKHGHILSEIELEEEIYLSSIFETRALKVIKGLENTIRKIEAESESNGKFLKLLIQNQVEKIKLLMTQVIEIKLRFKNV